jgi:hypothetical protein
MIVENGQLFGELEIEILTRGSRKQEILTEKPILHVAYARFSRSFTTPGTVGQLVRPIP